jgi:tight adherence protein B
VTPPWLLALGAFTAIALPALALMVSVVRQRGGALGRLAAVERLQQELLNPRPGRAVTEAMPAEGTTPAGRDTPGQSGRGRAGMLARFAPARRLVAWAERDLGYTGWQLSPNSYLACRGCAPLLLGAAVAAFTARPAVLPLVALGIHLLASGLVGRRIAGYRRQVGRQTEEVINILVAHLRAGQSLMQSLQALTEEAPLPSRAEYDRVARQLALGTSIAEALRSMERRAPVTYVSLLVSALNLHHRIGGDLPTMLRIAADSVRDQVRLQDDLRTAAAGQVLAAYVVAALPIMLFAVMFLIDRPYVGGLLQPGWNMLLWAGGVMETGGFLMMRSFTRIEL